MNLTKKEILQLYLDRAYLGGGTFGLAAAADFYFGKNIKDLTLAEAAMLAGLFKAPTKYAPHINLPAARARANEVLSNMVQGGFLTEGQVLSARLHPADVVDRGDRKSPDYFLDYAFEEAKRIASKYGIHSMVARTTVDLDLQSAAEETLEYHLRQYGKEYGVTQGAIVMLENNGAVRAIVGGRDYGESQFNRATKALRQAGSSFKIYTYTAAMEAGMTPDTIVVDGPISWGNWSPKNYGRSYAGRITITTALTRSLNSVPVHLAKEKLSIPVIKAEAEKMGVESPLESHKTMVLGTSGMTVLDQATGYNTLANGGFVGTRHAISQLVTRTGDVFYDFDRDGPKPKRVVSEKAMSEMNSMLVQVPEIGTGRRAAIPGIRVAGKTGTTQSYRDAWFCGFTGNYTAAVWMGNDDFRPTRDMTGGSLPAMTWQRLMEYAHKNLDLKPIPGIEHPFVDQKTAAKAAEAEKAEAEKNPEQKLDRPAVLSHASTEFLKELSGRFRSAPVIEVPTEPKTLSAL